MASTYSNLKIQLMATGENNTTWGNVTNTNLGTALEEAITGSVDVTFASGDVTLTLTNTNATQSARNLRLNCTGTTGGARNLVLGSGCQIEKVYIVNNGCADAITVKNTTGSGIAVPAGKTMYVFNNGTNVVDAITHLSSLTLASALPIASGGTGSNTGDGSGLTNLNASNISSGTIANARTTAASANGASTIVARDASGNFAANTITANLTGTAANATVLQTARTIAIQDGVTGTATSFNGSANISIPVTGINASVIDTGTIANARTTASSSNGASTIVARDASGDFTGRNVSATNFIGALNGSGANVSSINASNISSGTIANARTTASDANGASTIVARDASGNFSANIITANGSAITSLNASNISSGTIANARTTATDVNGASTIVARDASGNFSANIITANGSALTSINASNISSGTVANARTTASSSNGASTIVARDASGNFSAGTITANITGTASNATVLQTSRNFEISGGATASAVSFNGSGNVNLSVTGLNVSTANAGTLAVDRGGTGQTSLTLNNVILGNSTSAVQFVAPSTSGNVLTSNGTTWASTALTSLSVVTQDSSQNASGSSTLLFSSIPSKVKQITIMILSISTTTTGGDFFIELGDSGGIETSGYVGAVGDGGTSIIFSSFFRINLASTTDARSYSGVVTLTNVTGNTWAMTSTLACDSVALAGGVNMATGYKNLSATLDRVQLRTAGAGDFDAGSCNIFYF